MNITLFTPLFLEQQAVLPFLDNWTERLVDGHLYTQGIFHGKYQRFLITIVVTGSGNTSIANVVERAIAQVPPHFVFLMGVAGGVKDVKIGDVVIGITAYGYEAGKETIEGFVVRPRVFPASQDLISLAQLVSQQNQWRNRIKMKHSSPNVVFGPIASGEKVIASNRASVYQLLKRSYNDTTALEMEAYGFGQALRQHQNIRWLNIRSISDLLQDKNPEDDANYQPLAAATAAAFVFEMLHQFDANNFNLPIMNTKELTQAIYQILFPENRLKSEQTLAKLLAAVPHPAIRTLWQQVQPLVREEFEELQDDPSDSDAQASIRTKLKRTLNKNETLKKELEQLTQQVLGTKKKDASVNISNSKNVVSGNNTSGRDSYLGDGNTHIEQQVNNSSRPEKQYNISNNQGTIHIQQILKENTSNISPQKRQYGIEAIHQMIGNHKIKTALEELLRLSKGMDLEVQNQVILLTSRWNRIRQEKFNGTMTTEQMNIQQNRVLGGILGILEEF